MCFLQKVRGLSLLDKVKSTDICQSLNIESINQFLINQFYFVIKQHYPVQYMKNKTKKQLQQTIKKQNNYIVNQ